MIKNEISSRSKILELEKTLLDNVDEENIIGNKGEIVRSEKFPLKHTFADGIYVRQMEMKQGQVVVGAIHNHLHAWFLMKGRVLINNNGEKVEHIAPCYTVSQPGSKRFIYALEDSVFVNVHKNPSNTKDIEKLEKEIVSFDIEKFKEKN